MRSLNEALNCPEVYHYNPTKPRARILLTEARLHYSSPLLLESLEVQGSPAFCLALLFHPAQSSQLDIAQQNVS